MNAFHNPRLDKDDAAVIIAALAKANSNLDPTDVIQAVRDGIRSVRSAAVVLDCTMEDVQLAAWGEIRL